MPTMTTCWMVTVGLGLLLACAGEGGGNATDAAPESILDVASESGPDALDVAADDVSPGGLPKALPFAYTRAAVGEPVAMAEVTTFTREVMTFLKDIRYFDYVLYTTHGVDASTGLPDWQFWYNERFRKEGDLVTFYHPENKLDGGHNLHIPLSRVLGDVIAAYLVVGDPTMGLAAEQLCKGLSASMRGMVHDADDPVQHLMARNVVPGFTQQFTTHDGKRKGVDCSGWFFPNVKWNTWRFEYTQNPWWGDVWVTNMRSKDDVPHIFRLVPNLRYLAEQGPPGPAREACADTLGLLGRYARDIVESGYVLRTKDQEGTVFVPGMLGDPELDGDKDLASFVTYEALIPNAECNAKRGAELIGYGHAVASQCGTGEPNTYDRVAFIGNGYNKRICRYFHLAHLANALVTGDADAPLLLAGLETRMKEEWATPEAKMQVPPEDWYRTLALYHAQAAVFGYPLTADEVRLIHRYYRLAVEKLAAWPTWDPWSPQVPDGDGQSYRPPGCEGPDDARTCWFSVEDLAQVFEACWTPFANPAGAPWVDCDVVRDPSWWAH